MSAAPVGAGGEGTGSSSRLARLRAGWDRQSLAWQFFVVGGTVSLLAALIVGAVVSALVERAVTRNAGAATALYVDSVIAPLLPDMRKNQRLDETVQRALDETLGQGALGDRLVAMRLWRADGTILYSDNRRLIGRRFVPSADLEQAFAGDMVADYGEFDVLDPASDLPAEPLLEDLTIPSCSRGRATWWRWSSSTRRRTNSPPRCKVRVSAAG